MKPSPSGSSDQLLAEIRGLRAEIQHAAANSLRAQILVGRLQLEEQRINILTSQVAEARRAQVAHAPVLAKAMDAVKSLEQVSAIGNRGRASAFADARAQLESAQREDERLRADEARLLDQLRANQRRWTDFSTKLDDLERGTPAQRK